MGDDFDEGDSDRENEEDEFQENEEAAVLKKREEIVFCPKDGEYMPYHVKGAIVVRRCPKCGFEREGGS